jgi:hypothetical protein
MKLLNDIIDLLMNESGSLNEALLKTKVLLFKIGQQELVGWVNDEINGYATNESVPEYRRLQARVLGNVANLRYRYSNYQLPLMHLEPKFRDFLTSAPLAQSLGVLETLVGDGKKSLTVPIAPEFLGLLSQTFDGGYAVQNAWSQIEQSQVRQVLIEVRSRLLDFILALQKEIGEDMSDEDVKKVTAALDVKGMFHGAVLGDNVTIMVGHNGQQHVHNTNVKHDAGALAAELRKNGVGEDDIEALHSAIAQDPVPATTEQYGPAVKGWMSRMFGKALDGTWDIGVSVAGTLLAAVLQKYYGLPSS